MAIGQEFKGLTGLREDWDLGTVVGLDFGDGGGLRTVFSDGCRQMCGRD